MEKAQETMSKHMNQHRRKIDWTVGDFVYLSAKNLQSDRPSRKLDDQWKGLFEVLEQVGYSYRLRLPPGSKIHPVFALDVLAKDLHNLLLGQELAKPDAEVIVGQEEYVVEDILAVRLNYRKLQY